MADPHRIVTFRALALGLFTLIVVTIPPAMNSALAVQERDQAIPAPTGYSRPLLFAPEDNGITTDNPQIKWLFDRPGLRAKFNGLRLDASMIRFHLEQTRRGFAEPGPDSSGDTPPSLITSFAFAWPEVLTPFGTFALETLEGKVVWSHPIGASERRQWRQILSTQNFAPHESFHETLWGRMDLTRDIIAVLRQGGPYRACVFHDLADRQGMRACTAPFVVRANGEELRLDYESNEGSERPWNIGVYINGKLIGKRGIVNFKPGQALNFRIVYADRSSIEVTTHPAELGLLDVVESRSGQEIILTGHGSPPLGRPRVVSRPATHFWAPTGIPAERIWQIAVPRQSPTLRVLGAFRIPFTILLRFDRLPKETDRVYLKDTRSSGTYSELPRIQGHIPFAAKVSSEEKRASLIGEELFEWHFSAPMKGDRNRSKIQIHRENQSWTAHHRMFRGYPFEASGRLTGVMSMDGLQLIFLGEVSAGAWFETLFGWQNNLFSVQRWGMTGRHFEMLGSSVEYSPGRQINRFSSTNVDLKYHLLPGIWGRDEVVGVNFSAQQVTIGPVTAEMLGMGAYWGRTMPKIFDDLFNFVPVMRYPKYVDMEFTYFPYSPSPGITAGSSFHLNFHGRVFWTERFFGEGGFGIKNFAFNEASRARPVKFSISYGTVGLGLVF